MHRQYFANQAKSWQHHNINSWVGIEPEKVLIYHNISPKGGVEKAGVGNYVEAQQNQSARQHWGRQYRQDAGAQHGPAVHWQLH